jgi:PhoPQ-activated pathogenicity-related protein
MICLKLTATPLDDYIQEPDPSFTWTVQERFKGEDYDAYLIQMVSQKWRQSCEVDHPRWVHQVTVVVPKQLNHRTAILTIEGSPEAIPTATSSPELIVLARRLQTVACSVNLVPNQPLKFLDESDPKYQESGRREDALVAYTWNKYLKNGDSQWPLRLPMTKAVVRAMDAVQAFMADDLKMTDSTDGFILIGKSKRGWTAWTTAAVDQRVKGIVPIIIDMLNLKESFLRHFRAYGAWSFALQNYMEIDLPSKWETKRFEELMQVVEPYSYLQRFTMPKFIINASGDEFFLPDSSRLYFDKLPGKNHLLYLPNSGHFTPDEVYHRPIFAYLQYMLNGKKMPTPSWNIDSDGNIVLKSDIPPSSVRLWQAINPERRDFRYSSIGKAWSDTEVAPNGDKEYIVCLKAPEKGWKASFLELTYDNGEELPLRFSTDVFVVPDAMPYVYGAKQSSFQDSPSLTY